MSRAHAVRSRGAVVGLVVVVLTLAGLATACQDEGSASAAVGMGDADTGRQLFVDYGCATCHRVSGIREANGRVGPDLDAIDEQRIIAGVVPNTPASLSAWIQDPREYAPDTAMPDVGVGPEDAGHITAFLLER